MLYVENGFSAEEETAMISSDTVLRRTKETLRRAQVNTVGRNDSVNVLTVTLGKKGVGQS